MNEIDEVIALRRENLELKARVEEIHGFCEEEAEGIAIRLAISPNVVIAKVLTAIGLIVDQEKARGISDDLIDGAKKGILLIGNGE